MKVLLSLLLMLALSPGMARAADAHGPGDQDTPSSCDAKGLIYHGMGKCADIKIKTVTRDGGQSIEIEVHE